MNIETLYRRNHLSGQRTCNEISAVLDGRRQSLLIVRYVCVSRSELAFSMLVVHIMIYWWFTSEQTSGDRFKLYMDGGTSPAGKTLRIKVAGFSKRHPSMAYEASWDFTKHVFLRRMGWQYFFDNRRMKTRIFENCLQTVVYSPNPKHCWKVNAKDWYFWIVVRASWCYQAVMLNLKAACAATEGNSIRIRKW